MPVAGLASPVGPLWLTEKDGVFSLWKGQQHIQLRPAFFKGT